MNKNEDVEEIKEMTLNQLAQRDQIFIYLKNSEKTNVDQALKGISQEDRVQIFKLVDQEIAKEGFEKTSGQLIYLFIRLLCLSQKEAIDISQSLSDNAKASLKSLIARNKNQLDFVDAAKDIMASQIEDGTYHGWNLKDKAVKGMPTVLFIPPFEGKPLKAGSFLSPQLGVQRITAFLKQVGIDASVYDPNLYGENGLYELVKEKNFDFIMFGSYHITYKFDVGLIINVDKLSPNSIIVVGNEGAAFAPKRFLGITPAIAVCSGFGEFVIARMMIDFDQTHEPIHQLRNIAGLYIMTPAGEIIETTPPPIISMRDYRVIELGLRFDDIPYGDYWDAALNYYSREQLKAIGAEGMVRTIRITTDSHCPRWPGCRYCSSPHYLRGAIGGKYHPVRLLEPADIKYIINRAIAAHPTTEAIFIHNYDFLIDKKRVYQFLDLIEHDKRYKNISFLCQASVRNVDFDLLKKLKAVGFKKIIYGIESFSPKILLDMNKGSVPDDNIKALKMTLKTGIVPYINLMFYPTASLEDNRITIDIATEFVKQGADIGVNFLIWALPGTPIMQEGHDFIMDSFQINGKTIKYPLFIKPDDKSMADIIQSAIELVPAITKEIENKYKLNWTLSFTVKNLIYFVAFYRAAGTSTEKVEEVIDDILARQKKFENRRN